MNGFTPHLYELLHGPQAHDISRLEEMTAEGVQAPQEHFSVYDMPAMYSPEPPAYTEPMAGSYEPIASTPEKMFAPEVVHEPEPEPVTYDSCVMTQELMQYLIDNLPDMSWPADPLQVGELTEAHEIIEAMDIGPSPFDPTLDQNHMEIQQSIMMIQEQFTDPFLM